MKGTRKCASMKNTNQMFSISITLRAAQIKAQRVIFSAPCTPWLDAKCPARNSSHPISPQTVSLLWRVLSRLLVYSDKNFEEHLCFPPDSLSACWSWTGASFESPFLVFFFSLNQLATLPDLGCYTSFWIIVDNPPEDTLFVAGLSCLEKFAIHSTFFWQINFCLFFVFQKIGIIIL